MLVRASGLRLADHFIHSLFEKNCEAPKRLLRVGAQTWEKWGAAGASHDNQRNAHIEGPGLQKTTKIQQEDPQRKEERTNFEAGEGRKERNFGPPTLRSPPLHFEPPPFSVFRCSGVQVFRCSGVQVFRCSGVQVFRGSGDQGIRCSGVQVFRCLRVQVLRVLRVLRVCGFDGFDGFAGFTGLRVFGFAPTT